MRSTIILFIGVLFFLSIPILQAQTPAFPGAEGGGRYVTGGRGGRVIYVTSLEDTNTEGTLRWAVGQTGSRTILFKVSGVIELKRQLDINNGDLTIAGQSAPGDGICIKDYTVQIKADNVIIRFLRFRMGDITKTENDAIWGRRQKDIIIDHCSMSWCTDECASFYDNENFTLQWCILSESLRNSVHGKGKHGYGGIWGGKSASFHHNLLAHHDSRNPRMCGSRYSNRPDLEVVDFRNNVIYNWGANNGYAGEGGKYNYVNNYYKPGPASSNRGRIFQPYPDNGGNSQPAGVWGLFYVDGNVVRGNVTTTKNNWEGIHPSTTKNKEELKSAIPFATPEVTTHDAYTAYDKVRELAGASLMRDAVDSRIIREVTDSTYTYNGSNGSTKGLIDSQTDVGGWPVYKTETAPVDTDNDGIPDGWLDRNFPGKRASNLNQEGYTYLEVYLNQLVEAIVDKQLADGIDTGIPAVNRDKRRAEIEYNHLTNEFRVISEIPVSSAHLYSAQGELLRQVTTAGQSANGKFLNLRPGVYILKAVLENGEGISSKVVVR